MRCEVCRTPIETGEPVVFVLQGPGAGPCPGQSGWYIADAHERCAPDFAATYDRRLCRGCGRTIWVRGGRRRHCSDRCRYVDFKRRQALSAAALAQGRVIYRDELYHLTRPENATGSGTGG